MLCGDKTFSIVVGVFQVILVILFGVAVNYAEYQDKSAESFYSCKSFFLIIIIKSFGGFLENMGYPV